MSKNKYSYVIHSNEVVAITSFAGKTLTGKAKCHPEDTYDLAKGMAIAAARCNVKVANKRLKRANDKYKAAKENLDSANRNLTKAAEYSYDALNDVIEAEKELKNILHN